jgi:hypothetical protein
MELTVTEGTIFGEKELKKLLANKDKLVAQDVGDGRNQYQVEIQKLKDKFKAENAKAKKQGFKNIKFKFGDTLKRVKKQEREGKFDRGAEDKTKKNLRKKMMDKKDFSKKGGVHAGSEGDIEAKLHQEIMDDPQYKKGKEKAKKQKNVHGSR